MQGGAVVLGMDGQTAEGAIQPAIDRLERARGKLVHFIVDAVFDDYPDVGVRISGQFHGGSVEGGGAVFSLAAGGGNGPYMLGGEHGRFGGEKGEGFAGIGPGDAGDGVGNVRDVAGAGCGADVNGRADVVVADAGKAGQDGERITVGAPGGCAESAAVETTGNTAECGAPPCATSAVRIDYVEAGFVRLGNVAHVGQRVWRAGVGNDGEACALRRRRCGLDAARQ